MAFIGGTNAADYLQGVVGEANEIEGFSGDDTLIGRGLGDFISAGDGDDEIVSYEGDDNIFAGDGDDDIFGYGGNDTVSAGDGSDEIFAGDDSYSVVGDADRIDGGRGQDVVSYEVTSVAVQVNLRTGTGAGGYAQGDTYRFVEDVKGSSVGDVLIGNGVSNVLEGLGGNDTIIGGGAGDFLFGGSGLDTLAYGGSVAGVTVNLAAGTATGGDATYDEFYEFENLSGSSFADRLTGDTAANQLFGLSGADVLGGLGGDDRINGGVGADSLFGSVGSDTLDYAGSSAGVIVSLAAGTATGGDALGDVFFDFENLSGSSFVDVLTGNAAANRLFGQGGADVLVGAAGADLLSGGADFDIFDYRGDTVGVLVDVRSSISRHGHAEGDSWSEAPEGLAGGSGNDSLGGSVGGNRLSGRAGNDFLAGYEGADTLSGEGGTDRFGYLALNESSAGVAGRDRITDFSVSGGDLIDLSLIDTNAGVAGDQAFSFIGTGAFTGVGGQVRYQQAGGNTFVFADANGDTIVDFSIALTGLLALTASGPGGDIVL